MMVDMWSTFHDTKMSVRTLYKYLEEAVLFRRRNYSQLSEARCAIMTELDAPELLCLCFLFCVCFFFLTLSFHFCFCFVFCFSFLFCVCFLFCFMFSLLSLRFLFCVFLFRNSRPQQKKPQRSSSVAQHDASSEAFQSHDIPGLEQLDRELLDRHGAPAARAPFSS